MNPKLQIAVVGATGVVGREILRVLAEAEHPGESVSAHASERSVGEEVPYGDESLEVEETSSDALRGKGLVFLAVPSDVARTLASVAQGHGAWVVDLSQAHRTDANVPLWHPKLPPASHVMPARGRIVSSPSALAAGVASVLEPLRNSFGVTQVWGMALLGASSAGSAGMTELERQTVGLLSSREIEATRFPHRLAFNVVPQVGDFAEDGWTSEEKALHAELSRWWPSPPLLGVTLAWAPVFFGHQLSLNVRLNVAGAADAVRSALAAPGVKVLDAPAEKVYPMPMLVTADSNVHVGRIRVMPQTPEVVSLICAWDNAALAANNAVDVGRLLTSRS